MSGVDGLRAALARGVTPGEAGRRRLAAGGDPAEDQAALARQRAAWEPLDEAETRAAIAVTTDEAVDPAALERRLTGTIIAEESRREVIAMTRDRTHGQNMSCEGGRIVEMICREEDVLQIRFDAFRAEWVQRVRFHAAVALNRFREALARHVRWEEESLFEEYEKRCLDRELPRVVQHHKEHERLLALAAHLDAQIADTMWPNTAPALEAAVDAQVEELQQALNAHRQMELHEIGCWLDRALTDAQVDEIATELEERGRPLS